MTAGPARFGVAVLYGSSCDHDACPVLSVPSPHGLYRVWQVHEAALNRAVEE